MDRFACSRPSRTGKASTRCSFRRSASTFNFQIAPIDLERGRLTGAPLLQVFRTETPSWSRDGRFLAYQAQGANGQPHLAIRELSSNRVRELHPPLVYMPQPQWFPD